MTRDEAVGWLARRRPSPPEALRARLVAAVRDREASLPDHLAREGAEMLARVAARPSGGRPNALDLLAADAFVTYAFEAQAEIDAGGLSDLAARVARFVEDP